MNTKKIKHLLNNIEKHIEHYEVINPKVSKATIGWQIDHSLKVINNVIKALQNSDPTEYKKDFKFIGSLFFTLGFFPRGKGKAPKSVKPPETILKEDLLSQLQRAKFNIETIEGLDKNAFFRHPLFGNINSKKVHRFLVLHTNHHLKIIKDILNN